MTVAVRNLDRIDRQILRLLQNDARLTNKALAERVGLAPSTCLARVQRLVDTGVIAGFRADVSPAAVGLHLQAIVFVQFQTHDAKLVERFNRELLARDEVVQVFYLAGAQDLVVHVLARDTEHLRRVVAVNIASHPEVRHVETNLVFEHRRTDTPIPDDPS
jgi:DNA-binding Lrp family transcriptional regulator